MDAQKQSLSNSATENCLDCKDTIFLEKREGDNSGNNKEVIRTLKQNLKIKEAA